MLRAVLARLVAAGGHATSADRLIDDLWEGNPPPTAVSVLQVHIHNLRRLVEPDRPRRAPSRFLVSKSSGYALELAPESVDAWHFEALLHDYEQRLRAPGTPDPLERRRLLDAALACWNGTAYEGLTGFGWAAQEAARLTDLRLTTAEMRAAVELELNRPTEVAIELRTLFDEHPEREEIARLLATAQYRAGQQAQALATLRHSREYLGAEYGIDPSPALRELEVAILSHAETLAGAGGPVASVPGVRVPPAPGQLGYNREQSALRETAARASGGRKLHIAWIAGEAGAGKTTLVETALHDLAAGSWTTLRGGCPEVDGAPPAWAWVEMLAGLDPAMAENLATADAFAIARTAVTLCTKRTTDGPVVLLIEDAHRADTATLQVLRQAVNWMRDQPVLLIITLRTSEATPGLHATAAALAPHTAQWLELTGLDLEATRQAVLDAGLPEISPETLQSLHRRTGGNPLFVRETAKLMAAQRLGGDSAEVPDTIRELIRTRLQRLSPAVATVLGQLAIWGDGVDLRILALSTAIGEDELIDLLAEAEVAALVRSDRTGRITFDHALIHDSVYQSIPQLRRGRMHWAALELLLTHAEDFPGLARDPEMLAHHAVLGARPETAARAIEFAREATRRSTDRGMAADTVQLWQSVIDLHELAGHRGAHATRADRVALLEAHCALVSAMAFQARWIEARQVRDRAVAQARELDDPALLVRALTSWRAPMLYPGMHLPQRDQPLVQAITACLAANPSDADRVRLLATAAYETFADYHDPGCSNRYAQEALTLARRTGDPESLCTAIAAVVISRFNSAADTTLARELLETAERAQLGRFRTQAHYALFRCALAAVDLREAFRQAELALTGTTDAELPQLLLAMSGFSAALAVLAGDLSAAAERYAELDANLARVGFAEGGVIRTGHVLCLSWVQGDLAPAIPRLRALYSAAPEFAGPMLALALLATDDVDHARTLYLESRGIRPEFYPSAELTCRAYVALGLGYLEDLPDLYRDLLPYAGTVVGLETTGLVFEPMDILLSRVCEALGDTERAQAHRTAADALTARLHAELAQLESLGLNPTRPRPRTAVDAH
ncbi:BTAD domain-containing putative transcriptional regulator [Nocardia heshunensis]